MYLLKRKGAYRVDKLANKVAIEYFSLVGELKGLKEKALIDMWHSKGNDGYVYYNDLKKRKKQQMQSKKSLRMPFCLYGVSMLFATL
ncbi:hypothetical protein HpBT274_16770 [Helicobacter pylori]